MFLFFTVLTKLDISVINLDQKKSSAAVVSKSEFFFFRVKFFATSKSFHKTVQIFCHSNARTLCWAFTINRHWKTTPPQTTPSSNPSSNSSNTTISKLATCKSELSQCSQNYEGDLNHATQQSPNTKRLLSQNQNITVLYHTRVTRGLCSKRYILYSLTFHTQGRWAKPMLRTSHLNLEGNEKKKLLACFLQALSPRSHTRT